MIEAKNNKESIWEKIEPFINLSAGEKLNWLEEAKRFVSSFVPPNKRLTPKEAFDKNHK